MFRINGHAAQVSRKVVKPVHLVLTIALCLYLVLAVGFFSVGGWAQDSVTLLSISPPSGTLTIGGIVTFTLEVKYTLQSDGKGKVETDLNAPGISNGRIHPKEVRDSNGTATITAKLGFVRNSSDCNSLPSDHDTCLVFQDGQKLELFPVLRGTNDRVLATGASTFYTLVEGQESNSCNPPIGPSSNKPVVSAVSPNTEQQGKSLIVNITGQYFAGTRSVEFENGINVNSFCVKSDTLIVAEIMIARDAETGPRDVVVTTPAGQTRGWKLFTVTTGTPPPTEKGTVSGRVTYFDLDTEKREGLVGVTVMLKDREPAPLFDESVGDGSLGRGIAQTDSNGFFIFQSVDNDDGAFENGRDLYVEVLIESPVAKLEIGESCNGSPIFGCQVFTWKGADTDGDGIAERNAIDTDATNTSKTHNINLEPEGDRAINRAAFVLFLLSQEHEKIRNDVNYILPPIPVRYYADTRGTSSFCAQGYYLDTGCDALDITPYINLYDSAVYVGTTVPAHEYGHYAMWHGRGGAYPRPFNLDKAPCAQGFEGHSLSTEYRNGSGPLIEGFAAFMEAVMRGSPIDEYGNNNIESQKWYDACDQGDMDGNFVEGSVASILWDLYDGINDDRIAGSFRLVWSLITDKGVNDMESLWNVWVNDRQLGMVQELAEVFTRNGISKTSVSGSDSVTLLSATPTEGWLTRGKNKGPWTVVFKLKVQYKLSSVKSGKIEIGYSTPSISEGRIKPRNVRKGSRSATLTTKLAITSDVRECRSLSGKVDTCLTIRDGETLQLFAVLRDRNNTKLAESRHAIYQIKLSNAGASSLTISAQDGAYQGIQVDIFSASGQLVFHTDWVSNGFTWHAQDMKGLQLANGVYLYVVRVRTPDGRIVASEIKKVVILR